MAVTHDDLADQMRENADQLRAGAARFSAIEARLDTIIESLVGLPGMQTEITATKARVDAMGEMFEVYVAVREAGKTTGRFVVFTGRVVKWADSVALGLVGILAAAKAFAWGLIR